MLIKSKKKSAEIARTFSFSQVSNHAVIMWDHVSNESVLLQDDSSLSSSND